MNRMLHSSGTRNKSEKENNLDFFFGILSTLSRNTRYVVNSKKEPITSSTHASQSHKEKMRIQNRIRIQYNSSLYI